MDENMIKDNTVLPKRMFFIDSENGIETLMEGFERLNKLDTLVIFHRGTLSKKARYQLDMSPAHLEWIECVDQGVKNSMDVQIIAELSLRLSRNEFDECYIISRDKGYIPAIHYLQREFSNYSYVMKLMPNIYQALYESSSNTFDSIDPNQSKNEIMQTLAFFLGNRAATTICAALSERSESLSSLAEQQSCKEANVQPNFDSKPLETTTNTHETANSITVLDFASLNQQEDGELTELKGIGEALSQKLKAVGINSAQKLKNIGAAKAWQRIQEQDPSFSTRWVFVFEAAIQDSSLNSIGSARRKQLKKEIKLKVS